MLSVRLDPKTEARMAKLSKRTGRSMSFYARKAIINFLEDMEDIYLAEKVLAKKNPRLSHAEVMKLAGLSE